MREVCATRRSASSSSESKPNRRARQARRRPRRHACTAGEAGVERGSKDEPGPDRGRIVQVGEPTAAPVEQQSTQGLIDLQSKSCSTRARSGRR